MNVDVDIVIPWVDGSDPEWQAEFSRFRGVEGDDFSVPRYRDWGMLRYLLRGIERFAPWVRTVHLVTWGHVPTWLNSARVNVVRHTDYIPPHYLPTFASRPIELNFHHIEGLAERFVLFNDDMLLLRPVARERFFADNGLPRDMARLSLIARSSISHTVLNMVEILNRRYDRRSVMRSNWRKWHSPKYGLANLLKTVDLAVWRDFAGLADTHQPQPYLRETFELLWREEFDVLDATCRQRFRSPLGVSHWLMRYEQLARGDFEPVSMRDALLDTLGDEWTGEYICRQKYAMVCLNDSAQITDYQGVRSRLEAALATILPEKSSYEI